MNIENASAPNRLGLALSGGGSRAAAFHRGTLQGLVDLGLDEHVDVISSVSGGSVFAAAWMVSKLEKKANDEFLMNMRDELLRGFIRRSISPRMFKLVLPSYSRTNLIAETFNRIFYHGHSLGDLPEKPKLCINTTVLNNGRVGKFSREGLSIWDFHDPDADPGHLATMAEFPLALAVAASAAFPVGLPPLRLNRHVFPSGIAFLNGLEGAKSIVLTDGGVLENLGVQTLLKSHRFATRDMVISDAGTQEKPWQPRFARNTTRSFATWLFSGQVLDRIMLIMNSKQNRWARQHVVGEVYSSRLAEALTAGSDDVSWKLLFNSNEKISRRQMLFVRVNQDWSHFMKSIPLRELAEIAVRVGGKASDVPGSRDPDVVEQFLSDANIRLDWAKAYYEQLGGDNGAKLVNNVPTSFAGLPRYLVRKLKYQAAWQIHAAHAIYGLSSVAHSL